MHIISTLKGSGGVKAHILSDDDAFPGLTLCGITISPGKRIEPPHRGVSLCKNCEREATVEAASARQQPIDNLYAHIQVTGDPVAMLEACVQHIERAIEIKGSVLLGPAETVLFARAARAVLGLLDALAWAGDLSATPETT